MIEKEGRGIIPKEEVGARPFYRPGDLITNIYGGVGVIVSAHTIVNGGRYEWSEDAWEDGSMPPMEHGWRPCYEVVWGKGGREGDSSEWKVAWWEAHEWSSVELGPFHKKKKVDKS